MAEDRYNRLSQTGLLIFIFALVFRFIVFLIVTPAWINVDEFYYLSRGKMIAQGLIPYRDFLIVYPPGASLLFSLQHLLLADAWVLTRILTLIVDACNAYLIFHLGERLFNRSAGVIASLLYVTNPISVFTNAASMSETYILLFTLTGLNLLLNKKPKIFLAGYFLAFAFFVKYYVLLLLVLPLVYFTCSRKGYGRILLYTPLFLIIFLLMTVSVSDYRSFIQQTILYYNIHVTQTYLYKAYMILLLLVLMQPHVVLAWPEFIRKKTFVHLWWYSSVFLIFFPAVFEHHFLLTLPASCVIAGGYLAGKINFSSFNARKLLFRGVSSIPVVSLFLTALFVLILLEFQLVSVLYHNNPQHLFSVVSPVVSYIKENTREGDVVLSDYGEFPYLAQRRPMLAYIWGYREFFRADDLIGKLSDSTLVVVTNERNYPPGFVDYLEKDFEFKEFGGGIRVFWKRESENI